LKRWKIEDDERQRQRDKNDAEYKARFKKIQDDEVERKRLKKHSDDEA